MPDPLQPKDFEGFWNRMGFELGYCVYVMRDDMDRVLYVGKTHVHSLRTRIQTHYKKKKWVKQEVAKIDIVLQDVSQAEAWIMEQYLIKGEAPKYTSHTRSSKGKPSGLIPLKGTEVKRLRLNLGLTQIQLAEQVGVSNATISDIERNESKPARAEVIEGLARALGINVQALLA